MQRPVSATVFGILNIVFGVLGVLVVLFSAMVMAMTDPQKDPVAKIMQNNPAYAAWVKISIPLGVLTSVVLLAAGIGLMGVKNWGRVLSIVYALFAIVMGIAGTVVNFLFLVRPLLEEASRQKGPEAAAAVGGAIAGGVGGCVGLIYPVLLLIFMTRPKLVAAFRGTDQPADQQSFDRFPDER